MAVFGIGMIIFVVR